jgi:hypothetical protein
LRRWADAEKSTVTADSDGGAVVWASCQPTDFFAQNQLFEFTIVAVPPAFLIRCQIAPAKFAEVKVRRVVASVTTQSSSRLVIFVSKVSYPLEIVCFSCDGNDMRG